MTTVLLVDTDPERAAQVEATLRRAGHTVWSCRSPGWALRLLDRARFEVVLVSAQLETMTGARLLEIVSQLAPDAVRLLRASSPDLDDAVRAVEEGKAARFLPEACDDQLLREAIAWAADPTEASSRPPALGLRLIA